MVTNFIFSFSFILCFHEGGKKEINLATVCHCMHVLVVNDIELNFGSRKNIEDER